MPAHQGMKIGWHGLVEGFRCRLCTPPFPWLGIKPKPQRYISPSTLGLLLDDPAIHLLDPRRQSVANGAFH